jgi:hypothetical protein
MSYLAQFLDISGFMEEGTDKTHEAPLDVSSYEGEVTDGTDKTPLNAAETGVSSVSSVPPPISTKKTAPSPASDPESRLPYWFAPNPAPGDVDLLDAILDIPAGAPWPAFGDSIEEGRRWNEAVLARRGKT